MNDVSDNSSNNSTNYSMGQLKRLIKQSDKEHSEIQKEYFKYKFYVSICGLIEFEEVFHNIKYRYYIILSEYELLIEYCHLYYRMFNLRGLTYNELHNLIEKYTSHMEKLESLSNILNVELEQLELIHCSEFRNAFEDEDLVNIISGKKTQYNFPEKIKKDKKRKLTMKVSTNCSDFRHYKTKRILKKSKYERDPYQHKSKYLAITNTANPKFLYE